MRKYAWGLALLWLCPVAIAQNRDSSFAASQREDTLSTIVISAIRQPQSLLAVPFSIDRLREPMRSLRNPRTLPEALAYVPGVFVQKTNHGGGSPFLRGLTGNQTLLMLDGIRLNNAIFRFGPNQYPNLIDAYTIAQVEVLKGSGSVQYGSDALGGVMHAFSRPLLPGMETGWHGGLGTRMTSRDMEYSLRAEAGYTGKKAAVRGGWTGRRFGDLYGGDTTGRQSPSGYREQDWDIKAVFTLGKQLTLTSSAQQVQQREVPLYHRVALENFHYYEFDPQLLRVIYARLEGRYAGQSLRAWRLTPLYKYSDEGRKYHRNGSLNYLEERDQVVSWGVVAETEWQFRPWWTSNTGIEYYRDRVSSQRMLTRNNLAENQRGLYPDGASQDQVSAYSLHALRFGAWSTSLGLRYTHVFNRVPGNYLGLPGQEQADARLGMGALVGNMSVQYQLRETQVFFANLSTGFRAPGIDDLGTLGLVDFRYEIPANGLKPERSTHTEIGYRLQQSGWQLQAALFYMRLSDLISRVRQGTDSLQGYPVYVKTNDQEAFIRGAEIAVSASPWKALWIQASLAAQYGQNLTRDEPLRRIPPVNGQCMIRYQFRIFYAAVELPWAFRQDRLAQGDKDDNRIPAGGTPGWILINLHGGMRTPNMDLRISLMNLLNEDYRTHGSGIHGMGRALTLQAFYRF